MNLKYSNTFLLPVLLVYFVEATYDALTTETTAVIRFLADIIREVALSKPVMIGSPLTSITFAFTLLAMFS